MRGDHWMSREGRLTVSAARFPIAAIIEMRDHRSKYTGPDIVPLDGLSAPLVGDMQKVIRAQAVLLEEAADAISYLLHRKCRNVPLHKALHATEAECRLVTTLARMTAVSRKAVAEGYSALHLDGEAYGCIDDPTREEEAAA